MFLLANKPKSASSKTNGSGCQRHAFSVLHSHGYWAKTSRHCSRAITQETRAHHDLLTGLWEAAGALAEQSSPEVMFPFKHTALKFLENKVQDPYSPQTAVFILYLRMSIFSHICSETWFRLFLFDQEEKIKRMVVEKYSKTTKEFAKVHVYFKSVSGTQPY